MIALIVIYMIGFFVSLGAFTHLYKGDRGRLYMVDYLILFAMILVWPLIWMISFGSWMVAK